VSQAASAHPSPAPDPVRQRRARRLFLLGGIVLGIVLAYFGFTTGIANPTHRGLGLLMFTLAVAPSLLWARRGVDQLPVFEVFLLTGAYVYALPLLTSHEELAEYSDDTITRAALMVVLFQSTLILTYQLVRGWPGRSPFFNEEILDQRLQKYIPTGLLLATAYIVTNTFFVGLIPYELNSIMRAVFYGIGIICTFVQTRRWGRGELRRDEQGLLCALLAIQIISQFSTLFLVGGVTTFVLALVGYVSGSHRLPLILMVAVFGCVAVLHNGKSEMRERYWGEYLIDRQQVPISGLPQFFSDWIADGIATPAQATATDDPEEEALASSLVDRTSLLQILCLVAYYSPEQLPLLDGKTYAQIPAQFVPRFFWPEKPPSHISTYTLSIYYGLQDENATQRTTIGFGMLAEAYANYGFLGVGVLGCLLGAFFKKIQALTAQSPLFSYAGLFLIVLMAWSFQTELTLSVWISSLYQACVAVLGVPFLMRNILG